MLTPVLHLRKSLLSQNPETQEQAAASLGHSAPHRELPLIISALNRDLTSQSMLTTRTVKLLINATSNHLAQLPLLSLHSQEDIIKKASDVFFASLRWSFQHKRYDELKDHAKSLAEELRVAREWNKSEVAA